MTSAFDQLGTRPRITGIGSLPHHNVDAALEFSFRMGIPFLPQIPIRNPWEYMIAQALEGLPGLQVEGDGGVSLNLGIWSSRAHAFQEKLDRALTLEDAAALESFEPSAASSSSWQPFIWELEERGIRLAKIQIAGPMTAQWALRSKDGTPLEKDAALTTQIFRLILARALAMSRRLQSIGVQPILYFDEPGLYGLSVSNPKHVLALQELKLLIQALRKREVLVGLHCCSNTDWNTILGLPLNLLSIDTALSLDHLLGKTRDTGDLDRFAASGGRLSLGVIPTTRSSALHSLGARELFGDLLGSFERAGGTWEKDPARVQSVLRGAIFTPACGLALHTVADAELILELLTEFHDYCQDALRRP